MKMNESREVLILDSEEKCSMVVYKYRNEVYYYFVYHFRCISAHLL